MKRRDVKNVSVGLVSLGCAKNAVDLQVMAGYLRKAGFRLADADAADIVLVNTCAFIASAREEAVNEILRACARKETGRCRFVVVAGCFAQRYGARLPALFPSVDAWLGIDELDRVASVMGLLLARASTSSPTAFVPTRAPCRVFDPPEPALRFTGAAYAYLKIAEGCAHRCAYCAIPGIRGKYRSRSTASIVKEARALLKTGVKELNVIAQDPMLYGVDFHDGKTNLVTLLRRLDALPGDFWIRVLYSYPSEITDEFLDWMNTSPHAVRYLDVPLQHTDPAVLKLMARGSAAAATRDAATRLRAAVPGVTLRTTVMTGFPGETPVRFARLLADLEQMDFDHLGAFAFSPEEGTPAAVLKGRPAARVAALREKQVMDAQKRRWRKRARGMVGGAYRALVVAPGVVRMASQAPDVDGVVYLNDEDVAVPVGSFVDVVLTRMCGFDFKGSLIRPGK